MSDNKPAKIRWAPRLRPRHLKRLYDSDARGFQDMELCDEVGSALYSRCRTFALVLERQVDCPACGTVFPVSSEATSRCPQTDCEWHTNKSEYDQSVRNHYAFPGGAVDAFLSFYRRYPSATTYREKMLLIDLLIHSFHVSAKTGEVTKSVASKLLEGNKKAVVRFLDELSALHPAQKTEWRRTVAGTIDRRMLRSDHWTVYKAGGAMSINVKAFDRKNATGHEYTRLNECRNRIRAEMLPDDPPIPLDEMIQGLKNVPAYMDHSVWAAWNAKEGIIVAHARAWLPLEDNLHMAHFDIEVLPEYRRQGLGRQLLSHIVALARIEKRRLLMCETNERIPAGEAFAMRIGAKPGLTGKTNQLVIDDVDRDFLRQWQDQAGERAAGFEIGFWDGVYPEADIDAIVELVGLLNEIPFGDLEIDAFVITAEQLRQDEKSFFSRGFERWTFYVRERSTGKFAGYTEVLWNPNRPEIISQLMTGVFPEYRNKGLGRWLKAAMLEKILNERPQAKYVRTENADINAPMLKINTELGFKPYLSDCTWQVETEQVSKYLEGS